MSKMKSLAMALVLMLPLFAAADEELGEEAYGLLSSSFAYDAGYPLRARSPGRLESGGISFEKVVFQSFHDGVVPGLLAVPEAGEAPYPVVLLLHGLSGNKNQWLGDEFTRGGRVTRGLLEAGYAVMALDAQYHGERAIYNDYVDPGEMVFQRGWGVRYVNLMVQTVVDYRRAIDYLETRDDIDTARVGVAGYSMGGHMTFLLGAVEPRIRAVVACVVPATPGMPIAAPVFARGLEGTPLLMMMARRDRYYSVEQARELFDRVPGSRKTLRFFDSGHSLPEAYADELVAWVGRTL